MKILIARNTGEVIDSYEDVELEDIDSKVFNPAILDWMKKTFRNGVATETKPHMTAFEFTARKLVKIMSQRVGELDWGIEGDKIVTSHFITGGEFGTIDLENGRIHLAERFVKKLDPSCAMATKARMALLSIVNHIEAESKKM